MARKAMALLVVVVVAAACVDSGGTEGLSAEWLDFDPCELGEASAASSILGVKEISTEIIDTQSMFGEREITGRNCLFDAGGIGRKVTIWFGAGTQPLDRGGRQVDLTGIGDRAAMSVDTNPERNNEVLGIVVNVGDMSLLVMPPVADTPLDGSPEIEKLIEMARVATDRLKAEMAVRG